MSAYREIYNQWKNASYLDEDDRSKLEELNEAQLKDCFSGELGFGTGGIRGMMEPGPNRINRYTVRKATQGLADNLLSRFMHPTAPLPMTPVTIRTRWLLKRL